MTCTLVRAADELCAVIAAVKVLTFAVLAIAK